MLVTNDINHSGIEFNTNSKGNWVLLIDGDAFAYNAAFCGQKSVINILDNKGKFVKVFNNKTKAKEEFGKNMENLPNGWSVESRLELKDFNQVLYSLKSQLKSMYNFFEPKEVKIFLQGKKNFRNLVASVNKYKAGRLEKPYYLEPIRQYMVNELGAEVIDNYETDDKLSMLHYAEFKEALSKTNNLSEISQLCNTILITKDKDLKQIPGWSYNMNNFDGKIDFISPLGELWIEGEGKNRKFRFNGLKGFYYQMLIGDSTDGIPGIAGEVSAYELLKNCHDETNLYNKVKGAYVKKLGDVVTYTPWTEYVDPDAPKTQRVLKNKPKKIKVTIDEYIQEIATLLWMVREPFSEIEELETWKPPINGWSNIPHVEE
jgi:5'-3' exonuclease